MSGESPVLFSEWSFSGPPVWGPLERFCGVVNASGRAFERFELSPGSFMWMGSCGEVQAYKHCETRRYFHIDGAGHLYRYSGNGTGSDLVLVRNLAAEVRRVLS